MPLIVYRTDEAGNQIVLPVRFTLTAIVFGVLAIVCYVLCYTLCRERVVFEKKEGAGEGFLDMLKGLGRNRPLLALVCAALVLLLATLLGQAMNNYLFLDYFRNAKALSVANVVGIGGTLLLAPFISAIVLKFGKKEAGAVGMLVAGAVYLLLYLLRVKSIPLFMGLLFLGTLGAGLFNMVIWAFITDIIDYQEIATGRRRIRQAGGRHGLRSVLLCQEGGAGSGGGPGRVRADRHRLCVGGPVPDRGGSGADLHGGHAGAGGQLSGGVPDHMVRLSPDEAGGGAEYGNPAPEAGGGLAARGGFDWGKRAEFADICRLGGFGIDNICHIRYDE